MKWNVEKRCYETEWVKDWVIPLLVGGGVGLLVCLVVVFMAG